MADDDWGTWLQNLFGGQDAAQPYSGGAPAYGAGPGGVMPGGGVLNYPAATPGAPSMGYAARSGAVGAGLNPSVGPGGLPPGTPTAWGPTGQITRADLPYMQGGPLAANLANIGTSPTPAPQPTTTPTAPAPIDPYGLTRANAPIDPFTLRGPSTPAGTSTGAPAVVAQAPRPAGAAAAAPAANPAAIPGAPNLGYYRGTIGNARGNPTWMAGAPGANPIAPPIYRGPLALPQGSPSATPAIPPTATASIPPGPSPYGPNLPATPWKGPSAAQQATKYGWPFNMLGATNG